MATAHGWPYDWPIAIAMAIAIPRLQTHSSRNVYIVNLQNGALFAEGDNTGPKAKIGPKAK